MEREPERSLSEKSRRGDREDVKVIEWEEFDHELTRLWSFSSAIKLAEEKKQNLQPKLESLIQWLELTPSKGSSKADSKPISLRVALSFTPPTRFPSVLHMVEWKPSWKGSCFFPIIRKSRHAKSSTSVVDENETELIKLQMSDGAALKDDHAAKKK